MDLFEAADRRDAGIEEVSRPDFIEAGLGEIRHFPAGAEITGVEIREACEDAEITPHHCNAWGALTMAAVRAGLLEPTGQYTRSSRAASHARAIQIYRRTYL